MDFNAGKPLLMRSIILISLLISFSFSITKGQNRTYLGIETGPDWDINRTIDAGNYFSQSTTFSSVIGISVWQELLNNMFIGTGCYYHTYFSGINPDDQRPVRAAWESFPAVLVPVRLSYRIQTSEFPVGLTAKAGYQLGWVVGSPDPYSARSRIVSPEGALLNYTYTENPTLRNTLHLLEFGASVDYLFENSWKVALEFTHFSGLSDVFTADLDYSDGSASYASTYTMDGGRLQTTFNLYVPVSNIWNKRDLRIRTRIENNSWSGSGVRKKQSIYFGGDIGALWRQFRTSNPAIGPRPMSERGIFRYSNLHTGGYFGYMFNDRVGLDIGAWYQRSSLFFALMYDHETDHVTRDRAPFFIEVPLTFRYFHPVYKNDLHLVPTLGISAFTHFSGSDYGTGSGTFDLSGTPVDFNYSGSRMRRFGMAVKAGIGAEYRLPVRFPLIATTYLHYNHGLFNIDQVNITTLMPELPEASTVQYLGSGWKLSAGIKVPILLGKENRKCGAQMPTR